MILTETQNLKNLALAAKDRHVSEAQLKRFITQAYIPQPKQLDFHGLARLAQFSNVRYIAQGGTRSSAKTHTALAQVGLDDCQRCPGLKVLFLRKLGVAAKESFEDVTEKVYQGLSYKKPGSDKTMKFPNGSRIIFGGYKDEKDIDRYLGIEYDLIVVEEATQLSEAKIIKIDGSLRTTRDDWRVAMYLTFNPEGIGLQWAKKRHYTPWLEGKEDGTKSRFIFSTYKDNKYTDPDYAEYLEGLTGALGKAWREGDFDVFIGHAFPNYQRDLHVVKSFPTPPYWTYWTGTDDGYVKPFCNLWLAKDPETERTYVVREAYRELLTNDTQARLINDMTDEDWVIYKRLADPSMFNRSHRARAVSAADIYAEHNIHLVKANNDRIIGKRLVDSFLGLAPDGLPKLQIFDVCSNLISEIENLIFDEYKVEDVDTSLPDHAYDALRYALGRRARVGGQMSSRTQRALDAIKGI